MSESQTTPVQTALAEAVQAHQQLQSAEAELTRLHSLIGKQQQKIETLQAGRPDLTSLRTMGEDMLAAEMMGKATSAERRKFDEELQGAEEVAANQQPKIEQCKRAIAGITREAEALAARIVGLRADRMWRLRVLVTAQAEEVGAAYVRNAQQLRTDYLRLRGLQVLARHLGGHDDFTIARVFDMEIPAFGLEAFANVRLHLYDGHIVKTVHTFNGNTGPNAALQELANLAQQGGIEIGWRELELDEMAGVAGVLGDPYPKCPEGDAE